MRLLKHALCLAALAGLAPLANAQSVVGTAFTYQGRLDDNGQPANGVYDFQFQLAPAATGSFVGASQLVDDVNVVNGLFTVRLNFGAAFPGDARFIEARVRPGPNTGLFTPLAPRQELTPAPYAAGLALPFSEAQASASSLFTLDQNGTGNCMTLLGTSGDCLNVGTDGSGDALYAHTSGAGANAVYAQTTGGGVPIYGYNLGAGGNTAFFRSENVSNPANCVEIQENGTGMGLHVTARAGRAGFFENTTASNFGTTLMASTNGGGPAISGATTGANGAGIFSINNPASSHSALEATTNGAGPAGRFNGALEVNGPTTANGTATINGNATVNGDATVNGKLKAEFGGVLNRATPIAWGRFTTNSNHNPTLLSSSGNVNVFWVSGAGYRVHVSGETGSSWWAPVGTILYDGVAPEHAYMLRTSLPDANGNVDFSWNCSGCIIPNFDGDSLQIDFVIYN